MLAGRYKIQIKDSLPYVLKLQKMANEPCAFQLYKARHFYPLSEKGQVAKENGQSKNFKAELLKIANARLLSDKVYKAMI